jgi:hypothetical protein
MNKSEIRRLDLSAKFIEMGQALLNEGRSENDYGISQVGSMLIFLGGIIFDDDDIYEFGNLTSMFSAKKLIDSFENKNDEFNEFMAENTKNSYQDLIDKMNLIKKNIDKETKKKRKGKDGE